MTLNLKQTARLLIVALIPITLGAMIAPANAAEAKFIYPLVGKRVPAQPAGCFLPDGRAANCKVVKHLAEKKAANDALNAQIRQIEQQQAAQQRRAEKREFRREMVR